MVYFRSISVNVKVKTICMSTIVTISLLVVSVVVVVVVIPIQTIHSWGNIDQTWRNACRVKYIRINLSGAFLTLAYHLFMLIYNCMHVFECLRLYVYVCAGKKIHPTGYRRFA